MVLDRREFLLTVTAAGALGMQKGISALGPAEQARGAIYMTDMSLCRPQAALSRQALPNHWRLIDYESDKLKGIMIEAGQNADAPEIVFPLSRRGWHAIHIGIYSYWAHDIFQRSEPIPEDESRVLVRLSTDSTFTLLSHKWDRRRPEYEYIDEFFWKDADLTGQDLVLRQFCRQVFPPSASSSGKICNGCWIAYIKLIPLSEPESQQIVEEGNRDKDRRLFAHNDGFDFLYYLHPTTEGEIRREIEPYRESDFSRIYWEGAHGDICQYPTKIARTGYTWMKDHYTVGYRGAAECWSQLRSQDIEPFVVALAYAHKIGLEFHACIRTAGFHFPPPLDEWSLGGIYRAHPEWRGVDRRNRSSPRLSYAYPGVRDFVVSLLKEMAGYPIDGVCLLYNRRPPVIEYEPPVVEGFKAQYGLDPRAVEDMDERWLRYKATFLTLFMREVRKGMDDVASQQNRKRLPVSAVVMGQKQNFYYGMDVETWAKEGLVDTLIPYISSAAEASSTESWPDPQEVSHFVNITKGTSCKLALNIMPRQLPPEEFCRRAAGLYAAGVEHLFFWDTNQRVNIEPSWTALRRLGHREELEAWVNAGSPKMERPGSHLRKLGDWDLSYDSPG